MWDLVLLSNSRNHDVFIGRLINRPMNPNTPTRKGDIRIRMSSSRRMHHDGWRITMMVMCCDPCRHFGMLQLYLGAQVWSRTIDCGVLFMDTSKTYALCYCSIVDFLLFCCCFSVCVYYS